MRLSAGGADYVRQFLPGLHKFFEAVFFHPKPVVAAVNGHAIAGGCVLACCADRRIMARGDGRIGVTELLVGVPFPVLAFEIMRLAVPARYLPEVTLSGATYEPDAALERGFIDEIAEPAELLEDAYAVAQELAALVAGRLRADQGADPPGRPPSACAQRCGDRKGRYRHLGGAGDAVLYPRLCRADVEEVADAHFASQALPPRSRDEIGDDVLHADRQPHHVGSGAGLHLLRVGQLLVRGGSRVDDQRARVADIGEMREQLDIGHELHAGVVAALEPEGEHRARTLRHVFLRQRVIFVVLKPG